MEVFLIIGIAVLLVYERETNTQFLCVFSVHKRVDIYFLKKKE